VSLTLQRDTHDHDQQHHHPHARFARHGNTPCFTTEERFTAEEPPSHQKDSNIGQHTTPEAEPPTRGCREAADQRHRTCGNNADAMAFSRGKVWAGTVIVLGAT
jgi:hypothetical protein